MFSASEYWDMMLLYGECLQNARESARQYIVRYPNRAPPSPAVFLRLVNRARTTGILLPEKSAGRPRTARSVRNEGAVLGAFQRDPTRSIRTVAGILRLSRSTTQRVLRDNRRHAFHYSRVQNLLPEDFPLRVQFCRWILQKNEDDPGFLANILFTDESNFSRQGTFNTHNFHIWAEANPHAVFERCFQRRFSINLWAGLLGNRMIGPYEIPGTLNGVIYEEFLENTLPELLEDVPLQDRINQWFQHDGAPPHYARAVRDLLNNSYPNSWIGRGGPINWPPRSPDLTPLDFFLWGHLKNLVYRVEINTVDHLRERIAQALGSVTAEMIEAARHSLLRRARFCIDMGGGHFEHLL